MTENPYTPRNEQLSGQFPPPEGQPMNVYQAPDISGAQAAAKPSWPTVLGIISLCVAGLFGLGTIVGQIINSSGINPQQREMMKNAPDWVEPMQLAVAAFAVAAYVVLAIGAVRLLKRLRAARTLHVVYALMGIVMAIAGLVLTIILMNYMQMPSPAPPEMQPVLKILMIFGAIVGLLFALAYPVFLLIWFARPKVKAETRLWR